MNIYAMSDIHGCLVLFNEALELVDFSGENKLVLCGDYIHGGEDNYGVLDTIMKLEQKYGTDKVIVLAGNHEDMACNGLWSIGEGGFFGSKWDDDHNDDYYISWMQNLRRYYVEGNTIFVHAGIDEEAEDLWEWGTGESFFTEKYPAELGKFRCGEADMKIVAGHVGTAEIAGDPRYHGIYYDRESHFYIDGTVLDTGLVPNVIKVDTSNNKYYRVTENGEWLVLPYDEDD